jgi:hypothetical protein
MKGGLSYRCRNSDVHHTRRSRVLIRPGIIPFFGIDDTKRCRISFEAENEILIGKAGVRTAFFRRLLTAGIHQCLAGISYDDVVSSDFPSAARLRARSLVYTSETMTSARPSTRKEKTLIVGGSCMMPMMAT